MKFKIYIIEKICKSLSTIYKYHLYNYFKTYLINVINDPNNCINYNMFYVNVNYD